MRVCQFACPVVRMVRVMGDRNRYKGDLTRQHENAGKRGQLGYICIRYTCVSV
jgi:hypothetical protein